MLSQHRATLARLVMKPVATYVALKHWIRSIPTVRLREIAEAATALRLHETAAFVRTEIERRESEQPTVRVVRR